MNDARSNSCARCGKKVANRDRFCRHCGNSLVDPMENASALQKTEQMAIDRIAAEGRRVEVDTRVTVQEKIKRWITVSASFVGLTFAILAALGIKGWMDFRNNLEEIKQRAETRYKAISNEIDKLNNEVATARELSEDARKFSREATNMFKKASGLYSEIENRNEQINAQLEKIQRIQNSLFPITVHYGGDPENRAKVLRELRHALEGHGFVFRPEAVFDTGVQASEVIYYEKGSRPQAKLVQKALKQVRQSMDGEMLGSGAIGLRHADGFARRDIVVKLAGRD